MGTIENFFGSGAEEYKKSGGYDQKAALLDCISTGNVAQVEAAAESYIEHLHDLVKNDMDCARDVMHFMWAQFNLAATRAGLSEYHADEVHKEYYRRLESAENTEEILAMCMQHAVDLCEAVSNVRRELGYSEAVSACCAYIREHIYEKLTVDCLAETLHFGKSYLSHRFREETGTTILEFIHREKVEKAKLLLRSHIPISEISAELGFSSQSHFTALFKKFTGMTPHKFRNSR